MPFRPKSFSEQLLFAVTPINADGRKGTGFFFKFDINGKAADVLVSCRHIVKGAFRTSFKIHKGAKNLLNFEDPAGKAHEIFVEDSSKKWILHPNEEIDLAILPLETIISDAHEDLECPPYIFFLNELNIMSQEGLKTLNVVENILMVGCPIGLYDDENGLPLMRRGISSTHPSIDYQGKPLGLIDGPCFGGSSGSPLVISYDGLHIHKDGSIRQVNRKGILLGALFDMFVENCLEPISIPCVASQVSQVRAPANLGRYIKARVLLDFKPLFPG